MKIACLGDVMPGGLLHYEDGQNFCSQEVLDILKEVDLRVATLETAIGDVPSFDPEKMCRGRDVIHTPSVNLSRLSTLGIDVVSLANNHAWDLGFEGVKHTKAQLDRLGIKYCGAGANLNEAEAPAVIEIEGQTFAFIAYCDDKPGTCGYIPLATSSSPGINAMIEPNIKNNICHLKDRYDYLFVLMHWGKEYYYYPTPEVNRLARKMIEWGATGVIGSHSHQIQPTITYKGKPIIFSLGNFLFPDRLLISPRSTYYPNDLSLLSNYPRVYNFAIVNEPTLKVSKPTNRKGQIICLDIRPTKIDVVRHFTRLDSSNHITLYKGKQHLLFYLSAIFTKIPLYSLLFFVLRGCRYLRKKVSGEL